MSKFVAPLAHRGGIPHRWVTWRHGYLVMWPVVEMPHYFDRVTTTVGAMLGMVRPEIWERLAMWDPELAMAAARKILAPPDDEWEQKEEVAHALYAGVGVSRFFAADEEMSHARVLVGLPPELPPTVPRLDRQGGEAGSRDAK